MELIMTTLFGVFVILWHLAWIVIPAVAIAWWAGIPGAIYAYYNIKSLMEK